MNIEWKIEVSPTIHSIIKDFKNLDAALVSNKFFTDMMWKQVVMQIGKYIEQRFRDKAGWQALSSKYKKWKEYAVRKGLSIPVGNLGNRVCKLTEMGRLTNTMFVSATQKDKDANIFEINNMPNNVSFRYAISGEKLSYAYYFDKKRPFFYLTDDEAERIFTIIENQINSGINGIVP